MQSFRKHKALFSSVLLFVLSVLFVACSNTEALSESQVLLSTAFPIKSDITVTIPTSGDDKSAFDVKTYIILNDENTTINGNGASFENSVLTISGGGSYSLKGNLSNGRIVVDTKEPQESVSLYLDGISVSSSGDSPLYFASSVETVRLVLSDESKNDITYDSEAPAENQTQGSAAVRSVGNITVEGTGSLVIKTECATGMFSSGSVCIEDGSLNIESAEDAVCGKNGIIVTGGSIYAVCEGNGLCTTDSDPGKGSIVVSGGSIRVESKFDCIKSSLGITVSGGSFDLTSNGGSTQQPGKSNTGSSVQGDLPGIKTPIDAHSSRPIDAEGANAFSAERGLTISNGEFAVNSSADAFSCIGRLIITGGNFSVKTDRTAFYSASSMTVSGGNIKTDYCQNGIESKLTNISSGSIFINAQSSGFSTDSTVTQSGGTVVSVSANPAAKGKGIYTVTGGTVFAAGKHPVHGTNSTGNAQILSMVKASKNVLLAVTDEKGKSLFCLTLPEKCEGIWFSSPELVRGKSYNIYIGGINTGVQKNGVYQGSSYMPGTLSQTVTAK